MNQAKFQTWVIEEIVWWRWDADNPQADITCSKALQAMFDHPVTKLADLGIDHVPIIEAKLQQALKVKEDEKAVRFIADYKTRAGQPSYQHRARVYQESGRRWVMVECIDVTEMVQLEREIVDAQGRASLAQIYERQALLEDQNHLIQASYHKQSRFLALLSHELRSPLLGVKSMVNILKEQFPDNAYLVDRLRVINLTTEQMTFLVNDILTYSQTEYDAIVLHPKRFSLKQTFEYVKQLTKSIAKDKGVFVSLVYIGERDWVYGDSVRLAQILINLIVNGIKFTRYGGVSVEVKQGEGDLYKFQVTDSGEGISAEKLTEIFNPFVQFKTEGSTSSMGSGLGLSVVKQLVEVMGGGITVSSKIGTGTEFVFELELPGSSSANGAVEETPLKSPETDNQIAKLKLSQYRVLVVDDSKINRMVLLGFLRELGCQVKEAADGQQAWTLIQAETFDFIFLDIQMPVMDGFEVMQLINQKRKKGEIQALKSVFAITAGGGEELIPEGQTLQSLGFAKWFLKPISQQQVVNILTEADELSELLIAESTKKPVQLKKTKQKDQLSSEAFKVELAAIPAQFEGMIPAFADELKSNLSQMRTALKTGAWDEIETQAHYIKGNCMVFQLERWVEWLRKIELGAQSMRQAGLVPQGDGLIAEPVKTITQCIINLEKSLKYLEKTL